MVSFKMMVMFRILVKNVATGKITCDNLTYEHLLTFLENYAALNPFILIFQENRLV